MAESVWSVHTGTSDTRDSDLLITQPGTRLRLDGVKWDAHPFRPAPYYGLRYTRFFEQHPDWGFSVDFTHYKMYAQTGRTLQVDGSWKGVAVNGAAPMRQYVQRFEISHGVNMLSLNVMHRWTGAGWLDPRLQPYAGIGLAYYRPHAESRVDNAARGAGYVDSGFGYHLLAGLEMRLTPQLSILAEGRYNHGTARIGIAGGEAQTRLRTLHATVGLGYRF